MTGAQASIVGGDDAIAASASFVSLYATAGQADSITGAYDTIALVNAQARLQGGHDSVYFSGASSLTVSGSDDAFCFGAALGQSSIAGFNSTDTLHLSVADWTSYSALLSSGDLMQSGADTVIRLDASNTLTLTGVQAANLTAAQFVFG